MQNLQTLIDLLTCNRNIHISVVDLKGVLNTSAAKLEFKNIIHSMQFCCVAKSTERGYSVCLKCKKLANEKVINSKSPFSGHCIYGLYETAVPVVLDNDVVAIVYVGNAIINDCTTRNRIRQISAITNVSEQSLLSQLNQCEHIKTSDELYQVGEIVVDYIKMLCSRNRTDESKNNWIVNLMKRYANESFCYNVSLKEFSVDHRRNEKYIGRLFKKETGKTFSEYCMDLRLNKAENALQQSDALVIDIAYECGFNNISYFNKVFKKKHGITPIQYRKEMNR